MVCHGTFLFFKYILLIMLLQLSHFFLPFIPLYPAHPLPPVFPHLVISMGHSCKFFGFSISYTILNLPLSILSSFYLPIKLFIPCTFPPFSSLPSQLITLHVISISVILFLFQLFAWFVFIFLFVFFRFSCSQLLVCCHFTVYSFDLLFFLDKSL